MGRFRLFDLNPEQYSAATHPGGPMLILAGAGTGKTRVITARIAWLVSQEVDPSGILAVTFTNKAAREMKERIAGMVESAPAKEITCSTFHSLCVRILRQHIHHLGYKNSFTIYDDSDQTGLVKKIINRVSAKDEKLDPGLARALISKAKNNSWSAPEDEETLIGAVYSRYQQELKNLNAVDFDDLLVLAVRVLSEFPEARESWRSKFRHLLVDEFQDTNRLQLQLVSLLASGDPPEVCVVGDDDQSIYGWRGAEISNILEFERHFPQPAVFKLEQNYRSTTQILDAANRLIRHNARRRGKNLWCETRGTKDVQILSMPNDRLEAEFVTTELAALRELEKIPWEHFAILYRMNAQSRLLEEQLRRLRIPYRLVGGRSFFDRREIKDVLAYLTVILNPSEDQSLLRILSTPPRGIGAVTVESAFERSAERECTLFESLTDAEFVGTLASRARESIARFADEMASLKIELSTPGANASDILLRYLTECGYFEDLKRSCKSPEEAANRESAVREILNDLGEYQNRRRGTLTDFLDQMTLDREREDDKTETASGVTLITLHASKGLEFPHVFLVGAEDGILPHDRSKEEGTIDEERRLFYVGITRAMRSLIITHCQQRTRFGSAVSCRQSPFLKEIEGDGVISSNHAEWSQQPIEEDSVSFLFDSLRRSLEESSS